MPKLFVIPTPIGNLEDMTYKAVRILKEVDVLFAEDTRKTAVLLKHYDISCRMIPFHQVNEHKILEKAMETIRSSEKSAIVTDAGTPGISDPGYLLIRECIRQDIEVACLPGATAFIPALIQSGIPADRFYFEGFLPHKKGRVSRFKYLAELDQTVILYESPHRLIRTLEQSIAYFGPERHASVSRELTKLYEETIRGTLQQLLAHFNSRKVKGEFVIVIEGKT